MTSHDVYGTEDNYIGSQTVGGFALSPPTTVKINTDMQFGAWLRDEMKIAG